MYELDWKNPINLTGMQRQNWAVEELKKGGGRIYYPELSNFRPKAVGKRVVVHSHVWIGEDVSIPDDVKIQAFAFIPNGVTLEQGVFIGPRVTFTNDRTPPDDEFQTTLVKKGAALGAGVVVRCGVTIGENSLIGCGAVVTKDVPDNEVWVGNPARFLHKK